MSAAYVAHLLELLEPLGVLKARKMFGGYGIYAEGVMFGLVADDELYLKVDEPLKERFIAAGLAPFQFEKNGKKVAMSYYLAPESALDDVDEMLSWARPSLAAAQRLKK